MPIEVILVKKGYNYYILVQTLKHLNWIFDELEGKKSHYFWTNIGNSGHCERAE
jgi:hypothetical protein